MLKSKQTDKLGFIEIQKLAELIYDINSTRAGVKYSSGQERTIKYWRETFPYNGLYIPRQKLLERVAYHVPGQGYQFDEIRIIRIHEEGTYYAALKMEDQRRNIWTYDVIVASQNITLHATNDIDAIYAVRRIMNNSDEFGPLISEFELPTDRRYQNNR